MPWSLERTEWKPQETTGKHSQVAMPLLAEVPAPQLVPSPVVARATFSGCLTEAARHSGMEDHEIADLIHVSHGYMSKFMRSVAQQWARRLVAFMRVTNSLAPLQWMADQMGCDVAPRAQQSARIRALEAELQQLRAAA